MGESSKFVNSEGVFFQPTHVYELRKFKSIQFKQLHLELSKEKWLLGFKINFAN